MIALIPKLKLTTEASKLYNNTNTTVDTVWLIQTNVFCYQYYFQADVEKKTTNI